MNSVDLAMKVRDICLANKVEWKININGSVDLEAFKDIPRDPKFYYRLRATLNSEEELSRLDYYLKYKRPPD